MRLLTVPLMLAAVGLSMPDIAMAQQAGEDSAARKPLEAYLRGHATGDGRFMRRAFLPTAHIEGIRDGAFVSWTTDEYIAGFNGKPAADEAQRKRWIDKIDISGNAGMARITLAYPSGTFTDYLVLLKVDGEWKIANKAWTREATQATP